MTSFLIFPQKLTFFANDPALHKQVVTIYNPHNVYFKYKILCTAPQKYSILRWDGTISPKHRADIFIRMTEITNANIGVIEKFRFLIYRLATPGEYSDCSVLCEHEIPAVLVAAEKCYKNDSLRSKAIRHVLRVDTSKRFTSAESIAALQQTELQRPNGVLDATERSHEEDSLRSKDMRHPIRVGSSRRLTSAESLALQGVEHQQPKDPFGPGLFANVLAFLCIAALAAPNSRTGRGSGSGEEDTSWIASYITLSMNQKLIAAYVLGLITMIVLRAH